MPELPEVETWRRLAHASGVGRRIIAVHCADDRIVMDQTNPSALKALLQGRAIVDTGRKGKHMWLALDPPGFLYIHFGMSGSLRHGPATEELPSHWKLCLDLDNGQRLGVSNPRRIGKIRWFEDIVPSAPLRSLGPDPLLEGLNLETVLAELSRRKSAIKTVLLDQRVFAGVGNWIADEVLFQARINPHTPANTLNRGRVETLCRCLKRILRRAVELGADDSLFPKSWMFHTRWGKQAATTLEGETICFEEIGGRTCAWVPGRQV